MSASALLKALQKIAGFFSSFSLISKKSLIELNKSQLVWLFSYKAKRLSGPVPLMGLA